MTKTATLPTPDLDLLKVSRTDDRKQIGHKVGLLVRVAAWERRVKQYELAEALGIRQPSLSKKISGDTPFTVDELMKVARLLNVEPSQLLPRLDSNQQPSG